MDMCGDFGSGELLPNQGLYIWSVMTDPHLHEQEAPDKLFLVWWLIFENLQDQVPIALTHPDKVLSSFSTCLDHCWKLSIEHAHVIGFFRF